MRPENSVTIRDVARKAGVSPGTASRAINNSPLVNEATRRRILEVAEELNYTPNLVARRLSLGKTLVVAVAVPFFTRPAFSERLSGAVSVLSQTEYDLVIHNIETPEQRDDCFRGIARRERADGALFLSLPPRDEETEQLATASVPIVLIDMDHPSLTMLHQVSVDGVAGGRAATQHLIDLGHTRIGFVGDIIDSPFNFVSSLHRHLGYRQALEAAGIPLCPDYYGEDQHGRREARQTAKRILALPDRPTAIFAASDTQAVGVLEAARDAGLRVTEDLSVIGYDDIEIADIMGLTTIRQMLFESGQRGMELLLETLENPHMEPVHDVLPTELIVRGTTAAPSRRWQ
ncbi:MAG: LacI family DNA-binding transcriptional regulator [Ardenticatenia bacterium]|nr:LacI family DNA-binding transcriptional regulator [Ardenticatenia bacterium]